MGLNFAKRIYELIDCSWSYSGFNAFRKRLAKEINIELDNMDGFGGDISWDTVNDPIKPLLHHSDCEGELSPDDCEIVYPRLLELVENWLDDDYDKINAIRLTETMKDCAADGCYLDFM